MIFVAVGTFLFGFDELVDAADTACRELGIEGSAQIGHSAVQPQHLEWVRFLPPDDLQRRLMTSKLLICHAGMGLIGDGLRAGCEVLLYPRRGATTKDHPANDQTEFARALASRLGLGLCLESANLPYAIATILERDVRTRHRVRPSNIPALLREHLMRTGQA